MPRRRPFTLLPHRDRDETSLVRSRPITVHTCESCGELTNQEGLCVECREPDSDIENSEH